MGVGVVLPEGSWSTQKVKKKKKKDKWCSQSWYLYCLVLALKSHNDYEYYEGKITVKHILLTKEKVQEILISVGAWCWCGAPVLIFAWWRLLALYNLFACLSLVLTAIRSNLGNVAWCSWEFRANFEPFSKRVLVLGYCCSSSSASVLTIALFLTSKHTALEFRSVHSPQIRSWCLALHHHLWPQCVWTKSHQNLINNLKGLHSPNYWLI